MAAFLQDVFDESRDDEGIARYGVLGIAKLSQQLDAKEEVLETLLSYLEVWHILLMVLLGFSHHL